MTPIPRAAELVEAVKVALTTNILRVTINKPIARLPPATREGEKKHKQKKSSPPAKKKDSHNTTLPPQPLPVKTTVTEKKMETTGLSEKPPVTEIADRKDPPQWFAEHMDKVGWSAVPTCAALLHLHHCVCSSACTRRRVYVSQQCILTVQQCNLFIQYLNHE